MPFVSVTRLRVRSWRYLPPFAIDALKSARQAARAPGNLATTLLADQGRVFWTVTVWTAVPEMKAFMLSGAHRVAMRNLPQWCDEAAIVHWTHDTADPPSWSEAHARLERDGRSSNVKHPSPVHLAHHFPPPRVRRFGERRFRSSS
jgi:hypothetical protein